MKYFSVLACTMLLLLPLTVFVQPDRQIQSLLSAARQAENFGLYGEGISLYENVLQQSEQKGDMKSLFAALHGKVSLLCLQRKTAEALRVAETYQAKLEAQLRVEPAEWGWLYFTFSQVYRAKPTVDICFDYLEKAAACIPAVNDTLLEAKIYGAFAFCYAQKQMAGAAIDYGKRALQLYTLLNDTGGITRTHLLLAPVYHFRSDTAGWRTHCITGLQLAVQTGNRYNQMLGYNNLALFYRQTGRETEAFACLQKAYNLAGEGSWFPDRADIAINIAREFNNRKQYAQTLQWLEKEVFADTVQWPLSDQKRLLAQFTRYHAFMEMGRYREASEELEQYIKLGEKIHEADTALAMQYARQKLQVLEQEKKQLAQKWQIKRKNLGLLVLGSGLLATVMFLLFLYKKQQSAKHGLKAVQQEKELAVARARLQAQMEERTRVAKELHDDLGSSLAAVRLLTNSLQKEPGMGSRVQLQKIAALTGEMTAQMNDVIWSLNSQNDTPESLMAHVRRFATAFLNQAGIGIRIKEAAAALPQQIGSPIRKNVYLTVKEVLNNVVKHAEATQVEIDISVEPGVLQITIHDNGKGFSPSPLAGYGHGLKNMQQRMNEVGGHFKIGNDKGTTVQIFCPLNAYR